MSESLSKEAGALLIESVSKTFGPKTVLHDFGLEVGRGEIHALIGQNGSGKSTLIKVLGGYHEPDPGSRDVFVGGERLDYGSPQLVHDLGLRIVHQDLGLVADCTIQENLALGIGYETRWGTIRRASSRRRAVEALEAVGLDLDPDTLVSELTAAQRTGVAVARAMSGSERAVSALILDEPTATLPSEEVAHLHGMVQRAAANGVGIVYVSHHLDEVFLLADRVTVLRDGHKVLTEDVSEVSRDDLIHALVGGVVESVRRTKNELEAEAPVVLEVKGLWGDSLADVNFSVSRGETLGIHGLTGSGRESLLGTLFGARPRDGGVVVVNGAELDSRPDLAIQQGVAYLPPDRKRGGGLMNLSALENLTLPSMKKYFKAGFLRPREELREASEWMDRLTVRPARAAKAPLVSFSGGNQQKVLIGKWIRIAPKVMLLDEPTQGVDVGAKAELHRQIIEVARAGAAVVISSTDVEELALLCDRILIIRNGSITEEVVGDEINVASLEHRVLRSTDLKAEI